MISRASTNTSGTTYLYYACPSGRIEYNSLHNCNLPNFRAEQVDTAVWNYIASILENPKKVDRGWDEYRERKAQSNAPLLRRLELIDNLTAELKSKFDRLLDLYLSDDIQREDLTERKARLETEKTSLEAERQSILAQLQRTTLTEEQIQSINEFLDAIREELPFTGIATKRKIFQRLNVQVQLTIEDGERIAYVQCTLDYGAKKRINLRSETFMLS
jgi:hypothetical protein